MSGYRMPRGVLLGIAGVTGAVGVVAVATIRLWIYGYTLFTILPLAVGYVSAAALTITRRRTLGQCAAASLGGLVVLGLVLLAVAMEGLVCLVMALPLAIPFALIGGLVAYNAQNLGRRPGRVTMPAFLIVLGMVFCEAKLRYEAPLLEVRTAIEVKAPPSAVWQHVVTFSDLPEPNEWFFKTGIAYPVRATINGAGPGAIRRCEFTTGAFIEPIEVWDAPNRLAFPVTSNPRPMHETSPYGDIRPRHLEGNFESRRGQFLLTPLPGNRTRLEGTTWYVNRIWPVAYWQLWSDFIIHRIHLRVLEHIRTRAERR